MHISPLPLPRGSHMGVSLKLGKERGKEREKVREKEDVAGRGRRDFAGGKGISWVIDSALPIPIPHADVIRREVESRVMTSVMHLSILSFSKQKIQFYYQSCPHSRAEADLLPTPSVVTGWREHSQPQ